MPLYILHAAALQKEHSGISNHFKATKNKTPFSSEVLPNAKSSHLTLLVMDHAYQPDPPFEKYRPRNMLLYSSIVALPLFNGKFNEQILKKCNAYIANAILVRKF